jgi:hypothetical protein
MVVDAAFLLGSVPTLECGLGILLVSAGLLCFRWEDTAFGLLVVAAVGGVPVGVVVAILVLPIYDLDVVYLHHITIENTSIQHRVWSTYDEVVENHLHVARYQ